ncbi:MAG: hypothetical protein HKN45_07485, partial [Flavobacteriales bacterium]|nr:hypothetical protein [Flavobacteriales bacterium]
MAWLCLEPLSAQELSTLRTKWLNVEPSGVQLDSMIVIPESLIIINGDTLSTSVYDLDTWGKLTMSDAVVADSIFVSYRVLDIPYFTEIMLKDTGLIREEFEYQDPFAYRPQGVGNTASIIQLDGFEKRGSISRGIQVGNAQDLSVSSELNLQLSGRISDRISILANISDDNIPIQADGSSQQLQEFDQVYIKLFDEKSSLTAGDYQIASGRGYFSKYLKKARGGLFETTSLSLNGGPDEDYFTVKAGAAVSRGRFARNVIQGVEGSQGPYKLRGADNELFIIILSGTERVFIDGRLLERGKEYDYVIDYNAAEITFTANKLITKDRRIVVEFQYAEQNYARSLFQASTEFKKGNWQGFVSAYAEQDARNQPLQQELDDFDRAILGNIGDDINSAFSSSLDTVPFSEDQVLYALVDSLGYDSVFVFSTIPGVARYQVSFTRVGEGKGDYVEEDFTANGRVYRWVAPDTVNGQIVPQGDYVSGILLITPKKQQLYSAGLRYDIGK